ncbi:MAG: DEAD/DEAH box helicase family protein, partial [Mycobacteriales bacterium]
MNPGLYERLRTEALEVDLAVREGWDIEWGSVDDADAPVVLGRHVEVAVQRALKAQKDPARRLALVNEVLGLLGATDAVVIPPGQELRRLSPVAAPGRRAVTKERPVTPLSDTALLSNAHGEPALGTELRAELLSADGVDLLCAFVKWHGLRILEDQLRDTRERGVPLRVITTTYMGATERRALDRLVNDFGAEVKVHYDAARTRLHAKAWLFQRNSGFDTGYVGSSNLSRAALLDGVEWNVRLSAIATPGLILKFRATFDTYWNDASFESYLPERDAERLDAALALASGRSDLDQRPLALSGLEVRPFSYQLEMFEALRGERLLHDRHRNLIVAATGTGKTVIAALDYRGLVEDAGGRRPSLLFVAHRQEILTQALRTYQEVLGDANFGELYVAGDKPSTWQHVFASVQSLASYGVSKMAPDAYEIVVIDEFHHAAAPTYQALLEHLTPVELLGLTATPERADGFDVRSLFGGRTAAELRLWDALGADLLCPFHYFGIADGTDLRDVTWTRGAYDVKGLEGLYTGNDARARIVLKAVRDKILDPGSMRALGFCVSVDHAKYMARVFTEAGIPARAVSGETPREERAQALVDLRTREVNVLFAADLFNEGLDLPDVDTVLFLRPTESSTIFLQQLGRGLRRTRDKAVLTVLDFVGYHRKEFRFDRKLTALTGKTRKSLEREIEKD